MAIALDSGYPDDRAPGAFAGQQHLTAFARRREPVPGMHDYLSGSSVHLSEEGAQDAARGKLGSADQPAAAADGPAARVAGEADFNPRLIKESFAHVAENSEAAMGYFYARLFVHYPKMRPMFPHTMQDHMERVFAALTRIVWSIDSPDSLGIYLAQLGWDHRKFGVKDKHYEPFLAVLMDTVRYFTGHYWTDETQAAWTAVLDHAAKAMLDAAQADAARQPAWWVGEIVHHNRRSPHLAVLTIRPDPPLLYTPGQYVAVQVPRWPRVWRNFSIANAPREDGLIDLHVRAVPGGMVSGSLVHNTRPGDTVLLGPAQGEMTVPAELDRDLLCIAGGTGLAPLKAIIEGVLRAGGPFWRRKISLWYGARTEQDLYDLADLRVLESICPGLKVIPVVSHQPEFVGMKGMLSDVTVQCANCEDREVFISGPERMVRETARRLSSRAGADRIHHDPLDAVS